MLVEKPLEVTAVQEPNKKRDDLLCENRDFQNVFLLIFCACALDKKRAERVTRTTALMRAHPDKFPQRGWVETLAPGQGFEPR